MKHFNKPKGRRLKRYYVNYMVRHTDLHYCESHRFWYNTVEQEALLADGKPCIYTDKRYKPSEFNSYKQGAFGSWGRMRCNINYLIRKQMYSLKALIRRLNNDRNLPVGTIVDINTPYDDYYMYKVKKENTFDPKYEVSLPSYFNNFTSDDKMISLVNILRENGFLVDVYNYNSHFIAGHQDGEIAFAHGHGLIIGISTHDNTFNGYHNGCDSILYEFDEDFDKWSYCKKIDKKMDNNEMVKFLLNFKRDVNNDVTFDDYIKQQIEEGYLTEDGDNI